MGLSSLTVKDASGATHSMATQIAASLETAGTWPRALPVGGATPWHFIGLQATPQQIKGVQGQLFFIHTGNTALTQTSPPEPQVELFVKLYDSTAAPSVGVTVPVFTLVVAPGQACANPLPMPMQFNNGIWVACTLNAADNDGTDPGPNNMVLSVLYN